MIAWVRRNLDRLYRLATGNEREREQAGLELARDAVEQADPQDAKPGNPWLKQPQDHWVATKSRGDGSPVDWSRLEPTIGGLDTGPRQEDPLGSPEAIAERLGLRRPEKGGP